MHLFFLVNINFGTAFFLFSLNSVDGQRYFTCKPKYGSMVPIMAIEIGDFPPEDDGLDEDDDEI